MDRFEAIEWPCAGGHWWVVEHTGKDGSVTPVKQFARGREGRREAEAHAAQLNEEQPQ